MQNGYITKNGLPWNPEIFLKSQLNSFVSTINTGFCTYTFKNWCSYFSGIFEFSLKDRAAKPTFKEPNEDKKDS